MSKKVKDWFDIQLAIDLSSKIIKEYPEFNTTSFVEYIAKEYLDLEYSGRVELIAKALHKHLPKEYSKAIKILVGIMGSENLKETGMFKEYYWLLPISTFIILYGLDHYDESIKAIYELTKRNTGEYAIRPFLKKYPKKTYNLMKKWSKDSNYHIRRLASEGIRSRLPWSFKLDESINNPELVLDVINNLKEDNILFVKKSVANNLNDMLKDNYDYAINVINEWSKSDNVNTKWIVKHATRNIRKAKLKLVI